MRISHSPRGAGLSRIIRAILLFAALRVTLPAQTLTTLVDLNGTNGAGPNAPLVQGTDGNFYGTTTGGGLYNSGTIFKVTPGGSLTTLHSFCAPSTQGGCPDGYPYDGAWVTLANDGNFYGTTVEGGAPATNCNGFNVITGCGTIFRITPAGQLTTLYTFCSQPGCSDGFLPGAALVQGTDGNLYGTTQGGGGGAYGTYGSGTIFKITPAGALTTLYRFCWPNCTDGSEPAGLAQESDGNFYGITPLGGANNLGTVFKITPGGTLTTIYTFDGTQGAYPSGTLVQGSDGNFYGTEGHSGTIFKITPAGALSTLAVIGQFPYAGLVQAGDGNFYGTTYVGGTNDGYFCQNNGCGSLFRMTPSSGTVTALYNFCSEPNCADGFFPLAGLVQGTDGKLYGVTIGGGTVGGCGGNTCGTVFSFGPVVAPPVPLSGVATTASGLAYSRVSQTFNGTVTITNTSNAVITGPFQIVLTSLTSGVTLVNAAGTFGGWPYITVPGAASLASGQSATVSVQFRNPSNALIHFTPTIYSGSL